MCVCVWGGGGLCLVLVLCCRLCVVAYFVGDNMVSLIYPSELRLNIANTSDTEAAFLDLHLSISTDIVSTKIYDNRDDFDLEIANLPF